MKNVCKDKYEELISYRRKDKKRVKNTAEVFTPQVIVNEILDSFPPEVWKEDQTFLDPACGNGNFLKEVLKRKLDNNHDPLSALKSVYGLDIIPDNIRECRLRMLLLLMDYTNIQKEHIEQIFKNIRFLNPDKWEQGSLEYDMSFKGQPDPNDINIWYLSIKNEQIEKFESLPVTDDTIDYSYKTFNLI